MQVRCLASARNSGDAFDLRCEIREKMIAFLRETHPDALPHSRLQWAADDLGANGAVGDGRGAAPSAQALS
jgi:hypothetical protein